MTITLDEPVPVAYSEPGETRWGVHQFPALSRLPDGSILLTYADALDASETHGHPAPSFRSRDEGASWMPFKDDLTPVRPHFSVSQVFDGEYLVVPSLPYWDVAQNDTPLPEPAATGNTYGTVYSYRVRDLPAQVQAYFGTLGAYRWRPDGEGWREDTVHYDLEGLLAWRRADSTVLPRTFFERTLLRYEGELLYADYRAHYAREDGSVAGKGFASLMVSSDNGRTFIRRSTIARDPADCDLMGEPQLSPTSDGRLVCVIRRTDHEQKPMAITWSEDNGHTWTTPRDLFEFGVWPCVLLLGNGTLVLSYGRPGVHLAFDPAGSGEQWPLHNTLIEGDPAALSLHSCGYTSLLPLDDDSFLMAYSDFDAFDAEGRACKAILVRRVEISG